MRHWTSNILARKAVGAADQGDKPRTRLFASTTSNIIASSIGSSNRAPHPSFLSNHHALLSAVAPPHCHIFAIDSVRVDLRKKILGRVSVADGYTWICTSYACRDARLRVIRATDACGDVHESCGTRGGFIRTRSDRDSCGTAPPCAAIVCHITMRDCAQNASRLVSGCEEYLRERAPRRDTGAREVMVRRDSCSLRARRCGRRSAACGGTLSPAARHRARSAPGHAAMRGVAAEGPAYARVSGSHGCEPACTPSVEDAPTQPCVRVGGGPMTGGEPYDTLGMRETGVFEGRDSAANPRGACVSQWKRSGEATRASLPRFVRAVGAVARADGRAVKFEHWRGRVARKGGVHGTQGLGTSGIWWSCQPCDISVEEDEGR
ncbi:hypothetical protein C8R44DRAFT_861439 [Mycena epipterygia]|nr:hypothetical protein C8R44DRAFT_861439 [Mycena epipterygia]